VRFSGGANAGHTVFTSDGQKLVSHLIPCGLAQNKACVMGRGELIDLRLFIEELEQSKKILGKNLPQIFMDRQSAVWTPYHSLFESWIEASRGKKTIGTTNKAIGPLEGLYKLRIGPMVGQIFLDKNRLVKILEPLYKTLLPIFKEIKIRGIIGQPVGYGRDRTLQGHIPTPSEVADMLIGYAPKVKPFIADTSFVLHQMQNKRMLFEGAQALGLDSRFGTYPFVSSGNSAAFGAAEGTGLPMQSFDATLMVVKTLPTRVGAGPFPSEMWDRQNAMEFVKKNIELFTDKKIKAEFLSSALKKINSAQASRAELSQYFQVLGDERGATTGRGRSVGFIDIPWLLYAIRINGPKWLALTRFDMLSGVKTIPVVVGYRLNGKLLAPGQLPPPWDMGKVKPVFENWAGWKENIYGICRGADLPKAANNFLSRLEKHLRTPILLVGTGPGREDIVVRS
jgi:adenylosuccinate synthase